MAGMAVVTLDTFNFMLIVVLIVFVISIMRLFYDLPKLSRPWVLMLFSLLLFAVHYAAVLANEMEVGNPATNELIFQGFGTGFLVVLGISLYSFWRAWSRSK